MKKLLIVLILLVFLFVVAVGGGLAYAVMNANKIAKQYKPDLEKLASDNLGSKVTFGDISAHVFPSARLAISDAKLESEGQTLTLESLSLNVKLMPLLERKLQVTELVVDTPKITIFLEKDGFYIAGLPREKKEKESESPSADVPISVALENIALKDATITLVDKTADKQHDVKNLSAKAALAYEGSTVKLSKLDGSMTILDDMDVDFNGQGTTLDLDGGAFNIEKAQAKLLGNTFNVTGGVDPDDAKKALRLTSDRVDLASLGPIYDVFAPGINDLSITGQCSPDITVAWTSEGAYRANGKVGLSNAKWTVADIPLTDVKGTLDLDVTDKGMKFATTDMKGNVRNSPFTVEVHSAVSEKKAGVETMTAKVFDGTATLNSNVQLDGEMPFTTKLDLKEMQLNQFLAALVPDVPNNMTGTLKDVGGEVQGTINDNLMPSITGTARMHLADGLIKDVNIGKEVLGGINEIPFVSGTLLSAVPASMRGLIENDHTALESVTATYTIANQQMRTEDLAVKSDFFDMQAKGTIGFDTKLDLDAVIFFTKGFSDGLASQVDQMTVLFNEEGRLAFPVKIAGIPPNLSIMPNVGDLVKRAATGLVQQKATELIEKEVGGAVNEQIGGAINRLLGGGKDKPKSSAPDTSSATPQSAPPAPDAKAQPQTEVPAEPAQPAPAEQPPAEAPKEEAAPPPAEEPATPEEELKKEVERATNKLLRRVTGSNP